MHITNPTDTPRIGDAAEHTELIDLTRTLAANVTDSGATVAPGTRFGRYRILKPLGSGGMSVVYLAEQTAPVLRQVAIKVMTVGRFSPEHRLRFTIEGQSLARMAHPAIAQILDAGASPDGHLYFVMEHVAGESFDAWVTRRQPDLVTRIELLKDACRAVAHAHGKGVLHCDLKPTNLLVTEVDGRPFPKLIDFGIARMAGETGCEVAGTSAFMSPEQAAGIALDTRSDVFSLGVLLFETITGQRFREWSGSGIGIADACARIADELPRAANSARLAGVGRSRGRELDAILGRALVPDREQRYSSADALADDLGRWLAREPVQAVAAGDLYRFGCFIRRQPALTASVAVFIVVSAALIWSLVGQLAETRRERDTANQVTGVMLDTFRAADPYRHAGGSITARDLLRESAERLRAASLDPAVRMRVLATLGEVQSRLELFVDAAQTYEVAATLAAGVDEREPLRVAQAMALMNAEDFDAASTLADDALRQLRARGKPLALADALLVRAEIAEYAEDLALARTLLAEADALIKHTGNDELRHRWQRRSGRVALAGNDPETAVALLTAAYGTARQSLGEQNLGTLDTLSDLAIAHAQAGDLETSERERRSIVTLTEQIWGEDSPGLAVALSNLAALLQRRGGEERLREATSIAERAYAINRRMLGDDAMDTALAANNLANILAALGRHADALPLHEAAVLGLVSSLGTEHSHVGISLHNKARTLIALDQLDAATVALDAAGTILRNSLGETHPRYAVWQLTSAELALARGQHDRAETLLDQAIPILDKSFGATSAEGRRAADLRARIAASPR